MAVKLIFVLCGILSAVQTQGFFIQTMGPLGDLQSQILESKFNLISSMTSTRLQLNQLLFKTSIDQKLAKNTFEEQLLNLTSNVQTLSQSKPIDMTCLTHFGLARSDIQEKINAFAAYYPKEEIFVIRNDMVLLNRMIGASSKIMWTCRNQFPWMMTQMTELRECITNEFQVKEQSTEELKLKVDAGIESLELKNQLFFEGTTAEIDSLIEKAGSDFSTCISAGPVV